MTLADDLRASVRGEVRFDDGARALYATDASNYRQVPVGVVLPRDADDVAAGVAACRRRGVPVLARGGGTSLAGQCCNAAVVFDLSRHMHGILEIDPQSRRARVQPGVVLDDLRRAAERHHLTFGPDPSTHDHCTLGGMIGNNSCGVHSVMAGKTDDNVEELEVLTYDGLRLRVGPTPEEELAWIVAAGGRRGEIYAKLRELRDRYADLIRARFPAIPRRVSGYNLPQLLPENGFHVARALVGSESTCVTVLEASVRLVPSPPVRSLLVLGYPDVYAAADHVPEIMRHGPIGLEGLDDRLVEDMKTMDIHPRDVRLLPEGRGWLLVEFGGDSKEESDGQARGLMQALEREPSAPSMKLFDDESQEKKIWKVRESGLGATARVTGQPDTWEGWEDSSVPPAKLGNYLRDLRKLLEKFGYGCALYGHFGQGCVHTRIDFDLTTRGGIESFRSFLEEASDLVLSYGGSLSGEHGDGQSRGWLLPKMFGPELMQAFREFKAIWDPEGKMNPGKVVDAYPVDANLRLGTSYDPAAPKTHFKFPDDGGSFSRAVLRCVGVGECRKHEGGTMCPSYMATRAEEHSTRGRSRLLWEMLQGEVLGGGWRDRHVREALDLCLACKGCRSECPVHVDMATYKAEFLSHYYAGRLRPVAAYSMGLIRWWARAASWAPWLVNGLTQSSRLAPALKALGGIAPERRIPVFAARTFTSWFRARPARRAGRRVLLWPDTFNDHFHPAIASAAVEVLEDAGFQVVLPPAPLCCGRPLYDFGMLDLAERQLRRILDVLRPEIAAGTPVVGLEPSCVAVFRDELPNLLPHDEDAKRLVKQTFLLSELLDRHAEGWQVPQLERKAVVHGHCHHKAVLGMDAEESLLSKMRLDYELLDAGCCGMAGSFGFQKEHYDVSVACGERVLLPVVREAAPETLIVADGFSCREQISQLTGRRALHLAEVLLMALHARAGAPAPGQPALQRAPGESRPAWHGTARVATAAALMLVCGLAWGRR